MPGVHVMAEWRESVPNPVDTISKFYDAKETVTDASGQFEIPRLERRSYWTRDPNFKFFAPGYDIVGGGYVVTPPNGRYIIDPTVVRLRPLKTREELCAHVSGPLHEHAPLFRAAVNKYMTNRKCM